MLSIINSQTTDTDQAKAQKGKITAKGLISLFPTIVDAVTHDQEQAKKQIHLISPLSFVWPSFPTRKGTANTQEEQATAQIGILASLGVAIAGALVAAGAGRALDEIPLQELANTQEEQATAQIGILASLGIAIAGALAGAGASEGLSRIPLEEQVRTEDIDLAELISLLGNDQAIQQDDAKTQQFSDIISTLRNTAADAIPELTERAATFLTERLSDYLENLIRGTGGEQAKIEGGLTREQLEELLEMAPFIKE